MTESNEELEKFELALNQTILKLKLAKLSTEVLEVYVKAMSYHYNGSIINDLSKDNSEKIIENLTSTILKLTE